MCCGSMRETAVMATQRAYSQMAERGPRDSVLMEALRRCRTPWRWASAGASLTSLAWTRTRTTACSPAHRSRHAHLSPTCCPCGVTISFPGGQDAAVVQNMANGAC